MIHILKWFGDLFSGTYGAIWFELDYLDGLFGWFGDFIIGLSSPPHESSQPWIKEKL